MIEGKIQTLPVRSHAGEGVLFESDSEPEILSVPVFGFEQPA